MTRDDGAGCVTGSAMLTAVHDGRDLRRQRAGGAVIERSRRRRTCRHGHLPSTIAGEHPAAQRSLRVAFVTETYPPEVNGVALTMARVVAGLQRRNHDVQLVRPRQGHRRPTRPTAACASTRC
jgi:hypothetical protein